MNGVWFRVLYFLNKYHISKIYARINLWEINLARQGGENMAEYANLIVDISHEKLDRTFQYKIPEELKDCIFPGVQVEVPFGKENRLLKGYVIELTDETDYPKERIKSIERVIPQGVTLENRLISLAAWIRENYGGTMNQSLKTVLPIKEKQKQKEEKTILLAVSKEEAQKYLEICKKKHHIARERLLEAILLEEELSYRKATTEMNITSTVIHAMEKMGIIEVQTEYTFRNPLKQLKQIGNRQELIHLNLQQQEIVDTILEEFEKNIRKTYLIHGVTGSGKTAVYIELAAQAVQRGKQVIVLIPEISLTFQTVHRFYQRFGNRVSILNSRMSAGEKYDQYLLAERGELDVMIGPRSALFTPFSNLGFIIMDEEHENSYKSESVPRYHAREVAIQLAQMTNASVILGTATPSMESYEKAQRGEYHLFQMNQRVEEKPLAECEIVDLREELRKGNFSILSRRLQELMAEKLQKKQQIMLFLNRRGLMKFVCCRECGHVCKCPHCDVSLSQHNTGRMVCHYCGYSRKTVKKCPVCGSKYVGAFKAGTQKVEEIVKNSFPTAKILRMDYDSTRRKDDYQEILSSFSNGEADILIGTQMIVKGHDFPNVTLVGILAADLNMNEGDYHAAERTFQLLTQAAGRAGRGNQQGQVIIQTYQPEHYSIVLAAKQDYMEFFQQEMAYRKLLSYPPACHMMVMLVASKNAAYAERCAEILGEKVRQSLKKSVITGVEVIGPADTPVAKVKDIYKKVIYFKHEEYHELVRIKDALEAFTRRRKEFQNLTIQFDFNPMNGF